MGEDYNGWSNRETWAVSLHLSNDEGLYQATRNTVSTLTRLLDDEEKQDTEKQDYIIQALAKDLEEFVEELFNEFLTGGHNNKVIGFMISDVGSLWRVNWEEIAKSLLEDEFSVT